MKSLLAACFFISFFSPFMGLSQSDVLKWSKLSEAEMNLKITKLDSSASAVILGEYQNINVQYGHIIIQTHVRLKILNRNGLEHADVTLPYYVKDELEKITSVKAQTINILPGGKLEKTEIKGSEVFTIDINENWKAKKFTFPSVKEESIIEYISLKTTKDYLSLDEWYFQKELPVLYSELEVVFPDDLVYSSLMSGNKLAAKYRNVITNKFVLTDLAPKKPQVFVYDIDNYAEKIKFQLVSYKKFDEASRTYKEESVLGSWADLSREVSDGSEYLSFGRENKHYEEVLEKLEVQDKSPVEKLEIIYDYVGRNCNWNERNAIYNSQKASAFIEGKIGNTADINLYLVSLLKAAGIEAYPVLISTRSNGNITKLFPLLSQFNRMIAVAVLSNGQFFMNAASEEGSFRFPGQNDFVDEGFVIRKDNPDWMKMNIDHKSKQLYLIEVHFDDQGFPEYKVSSQYDGYDAQGMRLGIRKSGNQFIYDQLKNKNIAKLDTAVIENQNSLSRPLKVNYSIKSGESCAVNESLMYFDPFIFDEFQSNPFNEDRKNYPIELPYENTFNQIMTINIPNGFEVVGMPRSELFSLPSNMGKFQYTTRLLDASIQINMKVEFPVRVLTREMNKNMKEFYDILIEKINEQIVLKRINSDQPDSDPGKSSESH